MLLKGLSVYITWKFKDNPLHSITSRKQSDNINGKMKSTFSIRNVLVYIDCMSELFAVFLGINICRFYQGIFLHLYQSLYSGWNFCFNISSSSSIQKNSWIKPLKYGTHNCAENNETALQVDKPLVLPVYKSCCFVAWAAWADWVTALSTTAAVTAWSLVLVEVTTHHRRRVVTWGRFRSTAVNARHA